MTKFGDIRGITLLFTSAVLLSGCSQADMDHFYGRDVAPGAQPQYRSAAPDPWYAQQQAAREANMRAVQQQNYQNQMQNYRNGYRSTLPSY